MQCLIFSKNNLKLIPEKYKTQLSVILSGLFTMTHTCNNGVYGFLYLIPKTQIAYYVTDTVLDDDNAFVFM